MDEFELGQRLRALDGPTEPPRSLREDLWAALAAEIEAESVRRAAPLDDPRSAGHVIALSPQRTRHSNMPGAAIAGLALVIVLLAGLVSWWLNWGEVAVTDLPRGQWADASHSFAQGRVFPSGLVAGSEVIVWGGGRTGDRSGWYATGAALDLSSLTWRKVADGPLSAREAHVAVWTGDEMIVCCGRVEGAGAAAAAYEPASDTWREIASPPLTASFAEAVWTGQEMIVFGGVDPLGVRPNLKAAAYDPETDTWRTLADLPYPTERRASSAWSGSRIFVWPSPAHFEETRSYLPLSYDPLTDEWNELSLPSMPTPIVPSLVWTGTELLAWGVDQTAKTGVGIRYKPDSETWLPLPPAPLPVGTYFNGTPGSQAAVWTGEEMLVWAGWIGATFDEDITRLLSFRPATDSWLVLESAPIPVTGLYGTDTIIWTGSQLLVYTVATTLIYTPSS